MSKRLSYTKYEQELLPDFRAKINRAESTEDVKKFFVRTIQELFGQKAYQSTHLIGSEYLDDGRYGTGYKPKQLQGQQNLNFGVRYYWEYFQYITITWKKQS